MLGRSCGTPPRICITPRSNSSENPSAENRSRYAFAASIWAGNWESDVGGAETWALTINTLDTQKVAHADSLLALDEVNLAGDTRQGQSEVIGKAVFKLATRGGKQRYTDQTRVPKVRHATLSSSNVPLRELMSGPDAVRAAQQSRMITIQIPKNNAYGVLVSVPEGFADCRTALEGLRSAVDGVVACSSSTLQTRPRQTSRRSRKESRG